MAIISVVGLASHNDGDPSGGHPSATGYSLGTFGAIKTRLRDSGPIRVLSDAALAGYTQAAIDRWNVRMGRVVFQSVGSAPYDLRVRYKVGSECAGYNFRALQVSQDSLDQGSCGQTDVGAPDYEQSAGVVLVTSGSGTWGFDGLSDELKKTGLTHEIGHDLGLDDHYYQPTTPQCRTDVDSIMENWGCSTPNQFSEYYPTDHDAGDVRKAYEVGGVPWVNYFGVSNTDNGYFMFDTVNNAAHSVHNEQVSNGMRIRKKSSLEGAVIGSPSYQSRTLHVQGYTFNFAIDDGERCFSANGRNAYQLPTEGGDGSEACMNRQPIYYRKVIGTSDTQSDQARDYFRLFNLTFHGTITGAQLTYTNAAFIAWVTEAGQGAGTVRFPHYGTSGALDLPKGAYQFRFNVSGTGPYIIQLGLDD